MDAFDADMVILASKGDPRGSVLNNAVAGRVDNHTPAGIGSVVLLTETLALGSSTPHSLRLREILSALALVPVDANIARVAAALRATYRLKTPDALHLATAITAGADRFVTGNQRDFTTAIKEIPVVFPS
jgi:predicted nucleic acid-binding protein